MVLSIDLRITVYLGNIDSFETSHVGHFYFYFTVNRTLRLSVNVVLVDIVYATLNNLNNQPGFYVAIASSGESYHSSNGMYMYVYFYFFYFWGLRCIVCQTYESMTPIF